MTSKTIKTIAAFVLGILTCLASVFFFIGMAAVVSAKSSLNFDYIFIVLLTGILSGVLATLIYLEFFFKIKVE